MGCRDAKCIRFGGVNYWIWVGSRERLEFE